MSDAAELVDTERRLREIGISAASIARWRTMAQRDAQGRSFDELMAGIPDDWLKVIDEMRSVGVQLQPVPWEVWAHASGTGKSDHG
jgi:hypothetical protein